MNYVGYAELVRDSLALARKLPRDTVGILGIPRSGMLPATIIATELGLPLGDAFGDFFVGGRRAGALMPGEGVIVVVDDSYYMGATMNAAREEGARYGTAPGHGYLYAAVYVSPGKETELDYYERVIGPPRMFEWNWKSVVPEDTLWDLDGVICTDPDAFDDDGDGYLGALRRVRPLHLPETPIRAIVTGRLERWRPVTEAWLQQNGVRYQHLVMAPFETSAKRGAYGASAWKSDMIRGLGGTELFIESDEAAALFLAGNTGVAVLCPSAGKIYQL